MKQWFLLNIWTWCRDRAYYLVTAFAVIKISLGYLVHRAGFWVDPTIGHIRASIVVVIAQLCVLIIGLTKLYRSSLPNRWSVPAIAGWLGLLGVVLLSGWLLIISLLIFLAGAVYHWHKKI
jgi:ABC-type uncharacterized transport system permease subunit